MNIRIIVLSLAFVISGCAIEPTPLNQIDGQQGFTMNCNSGIEKCHQKSAELCPKGYDILDHSKKSSTLVPHYGEYPMIINAESLTIKCK